MNINILLYVLILECISVSRALDYCSNSNQIAYTITVDKAGKGNYTTIQQAIDSIPSSNSQWIQIFISAGKYLEKLTIPEDKPCIFLRGAARKFTIIEWGDHQATDLSATFTSYPDHIVCEGITFKNKFNLPNDENQIQFTPALAARVYGDKCVFSKCSFIGLQDTLWDATGRHMYDKCYFEGAVDFIWGYGQSIFQHCVINVTIGIYAPERGIGTITAQGRDSESDSNGFVFKYCVVVGSGKAFLGRAFGPFSRVIFYQSRFKDVVVPQGWDAWNYVGHEQNLVYAEINCNGPGANEAQRVRWIKKLSVAELKQLIQISFIDHEGWMAKLPSLS